MKEEINMEKYVKSMTSIAQKLAEHMKNKDSAGTKREKPFAQRSRYTQKGVRSKKVCQRCDKQILAKPGDEMILEKWIQVLRKTVSFVTDYETKVSQISYENCTSLLITKEKIDE